jgi:hypothetical protein
MRFRRWRWFLFAAIPIALIAAYFFWPTLIRDADFAASTRKLAGSNAVNCGRVNESRDPGLGVGCAIQAGQSGRAYFLIIDHQGIDSQISTGVARNTGGGKHVVSYDSSPCGQIVPSLSCPARLTAKRCASMSFDVKQLSVGDASRWSVKVACAE